MRVDHVQAARVANLVVDDDGLAVEAQVDALKAEEVQEPHGHGLGDFDPCIAERPAGVALEEGARAEVVDENAHAHAALMGLEAQAGRLGRKSLYLPGSFDYDEIRKQLKQLTDALGLPELTEDELAREQESCEEALAKAKNLIGDMPVTLDYLYHPRPLGLAKLLLTHGFCVKAVYLDSISPEEKADFFWLQEHAPELELIATIQVKMRVLPRGASGEVLAIGQKAAYFGRSRHFVNLVQGEGLYGFDGIRRTAELMMDAYLNEKDTEKLVVQKGWGSECCL